MVTNDMPQYNSDVSSIKPTKFTSVAGKAEKAEVYAKETDQLLEAKKVLDKYIEDNKLGGLLGSSFVYEGLMIRNREPALFH